MNLITLSLHLNSEDALGCAMSICRKHAIAVMCSSKVSLVVKLVMSCAHCLPVEAEATSSSESEARFSSKVVEGRLKNSEVLGKRNEPLSHLSEEGDLINLIHHHVIIFRFTNSHFQQSASICVKR